MKTEFSYFDLQENGGTYDSLAVKFAQCRVLEV